MRRKSERTASKKTKESSPEKKEDKPKRTRTRRKKQSTSSEESAGEEAGPALEVQPDLEAGQKLPTTPVKANAEENQDQVWQVKTADGAGAGGEIKKLKICLTRPPSTPERAERSPRSKRKHSRATSSSDTPSNEGIEDRKKTRRHRRSLRESREESDKTQDSQEEYDELKAEQKCEVSQSSETHQTETPMSTTTEEAKQEGPQQFTDEAATENQSKAATENQSKAATENQSKAATENQSKAATENQSPEKQSAENVDQCKLQNSSDVDTTVESPKAQSNSEANTSDQTTDPDFQRSQSVEKSEVLELHVDEHNEIAESVEHGESKDSRDKDGASGNREVSINEDKNKKSISEDARVHSKQNDVLESSGHVKRRSRQRSADRADLKKKSYQERRSRAMSTDSDKHKDDQNESRKELERSDSTQSQEEPVHNGQASTPLVINRKRRWGSRKTASLKSITISTDILKEIIPDVKPVEFTEIIEEKKHKRIELTDKVERPVLPKIIIDNSENVENIKKEYEVVQEHTKREPLSANRRISIVKEQDNIVTRPPSPPRNKQSNILFISNLVRPFTLPQLKNLLQRTGKIAENGFWIDKIKSKCFVQYENEDQAVETRHALHGVTWPVSNPKSLQVDFSTPEAFDKARQNEDIDNAQAVTIPGTVEDWLQELDQKRERGEPQERPWERKLIAREWDMGKGREKDLEQDKIKREERSNFDKRRHYSPERSPEPARKFKKKEEAPAKLLDDLFRKTKTTPCIYWLPLSAETIAVKEEQRRIHMAEHERRMQELQLRRERDRTHSHRDRRH